MMKAILLALCVVTACFAAPVKIQEPPKGSEWCSICSFIIGYIEGELANNNTEENIIHVVETVCDIVPGPLKSECRSLITIYGEDIIQLLINDEPPSVVCSQIGLCDSKAKVQEIVGSQGNDDCSVCQFLMGYIESELANNYTESNIEKVLDSICQIAPSSFRSQCVSLINEYTAQLIQLLVNQETPEVICQQIGLCSSAKEEMVVEVIKADEYCTICEFVMSTVDQYLGDNATDRQIISFVENVCYLLPSSVRQQCDDLIATYAVEIITLLIQDYPPNVVCTELGLCSSAKMDLFKGRASPLQCSVCTSVISETEALELQSSEAILMALTTACNFIPFPVPGCKVWVQQIGPAIVNQIKAKAPADQICASVGFCAQ